MKIKIIKKIEIVSYDIVKKVEVFEKEVKGFNFKEVSKVCGCNNEDGMGWGLVSKVKGVMVIGNVDGDVEFICVKV